MEGEVAVMEGRRRNSCLFWRRNVFLLCGGTTTGGQCE